MNAEENQLPNMVETRRHIGSMGIVQKFDVEEKTFTPLTNLNFGRLQAAAAVVCGKLYVTGGLLREELWDSDEDDSEAEPDEDSAGERFKRYGCFYAPGMEVYDVAPAATPAQRTRGCKTAPPKLQWGAPRRHSHAAVELAGRLFIVGGSTLGDDGDEPTTSVMCFVPGSARWFDMPPLPVASHRIVACVAGLRE